MKNFNKFFLVSLFTFLLFGFLGAYSAEASLPVYGPATITLTASSTSEIDLSWNSISADPAVTGYRIERESPSGGGFAVIVADTGSTATTYADKGLSPSTDYGYRIFAINTEGIGPASPNISAITTGMPPTAGVLPFAPQNFAATAVSGSGINLSWSQTQNYSPVTGYRIERDYITIVQNTGSAVTTYADINLSPGATYSYRITAINPFGLSPFSQVVLATTFTPPIAPQSASVVAGDGQATVSWKTPLFTGGGIVSYLISTISGTSTVSVSSNTMSVVVTGLTNGVSYSFGVSAVNPAGQSPAIATNSVVPMAPVAQATSTPAQPVIPPILVPAPIFTSRYIFASYLQIGSRGIAVTELQKRLVTDGFLTVTPTGYFGQMTNSALRAYQRAHNISQTGTLGPITRASINSK